MNICTNTRYVHIMCVTWGSIVICAAVMFYVLFPTLLPKLSDEESVSALGFSVCYKITGSKMK